MIEQLILNQLPKNRKRPPFVQFKGKLPCALEFIEFGDETEDFQVILRLPSKGP